MEHVKKILGGKLLAKTQTTPVNSYKKNLPTVNSITVKDKISSFLEENEIQPEGVAVTLAEKLDDMKSKDYYILLAKENPPDVLLRALSFTLDADRRGKIRTKKAIYFIGILKRWGVKTKFTRS